MDKKRQRRVYATRVQKKKLFTLMAEHPELMSCKVTEGFNQKDSERLWHNIARECNAIPGAKKTWRQWRKTWQDIKCKAKKQETTNEIPTSMTMIDPEALGLKNVSSTTNYQYPTEFVPSEEDNVNDNLSNHIESTSLNIDSESQEEDKIWLPTQEEDRICIPSQEITKNMEHDPELKHSNSCVFNCDMLAIHEQKKLQVKEDYYNFKKNYLQQKLTLIKEQTEALKTIAKELAK